MSQRTISESVSWLDAARFANLLAKEGVEVLWSEKGFFFDETERVAELAAKSGVALSPAETPEGALAIAPLRIAYYSCGAPMNYASILTSAGYTCSGITENEIKAGMLKYYDVLVVGGGGMNALIGELGPLGDQGVAEIQSFLRAGGMYMSSCAGSCIASILDDGFNEAYPCKRGLELARVRLFNNGSDAGFDFDGLVSPGVGIIQARRCADHPILWGMPETFPIVHYNGPIYVYADDELEGIGSPLALTQWDELTDRFTPFEQFLPSEAEGPTIAERAVAKKHYQTILSPVGDGKALLFGSHPEFGFTPFLNDVQQGARMIVNAMLWHSATRAGARTENGFACYIHEARSRRVATTESVDIEVATRIVEIQNYVKTFEKVGNHDPSWLETGVSITEFGTEPRAFWDAAYEQFPQQIERFCELFSANQASARRAQSVEAGLLAEEWLDNILYQRDPAANQDFGYHGIIALLDMCIDYFKMAEPHIHDATSRPAGVYADFATNPFLTTVGLYIGAAGAFAEALALAGMFRTRFDEQEIREITL